VFDGSASALVAAAEYLKPLQQRTFDNPMHEMIFPYVTTISVFVGTLTLTGSFIAFGKLQGFISGKPIVFPGQQAINGFLTLALVVMGVSVCIGGGQEMNMFYGVLILAAILGITLTIPIGGADMPVVISLLNSYSGLAAAATGFEFNSEITTGISAPPMGIVKVIPTKKEIKINIQNN
jgi:NAD(P) transhydrogenase subunit beta